MDPLRLLSRSTKKSRGNTTGPSPSLPSAGQAGQAQLFPHGESYAANGSKKRKRGEDNLTSSLSPKGVSSPPVMIADATSAGLSQARNPLSATSTPGSFAHDQNDKQDSSLLRQLSLSPQERRSILRNHKLKFTWLNPAALSKKERRKRKDEQKSTKALPQVFPEPLHSFKDLDSRFHVSHNLTANIADQGFGVPTEVQLGALPLLLDASAPYLKEADQGDSEPHDIPDGIDLLTVAPTGSGKTLAFLIPLLHILQVAKRGKTRAERHTLAIILAPTRELASQTVNEGRRLCQNTGLRITHMRKGMRLDCGSLALGGANNLEEDQDGSSTVVKADIVVSTPGILQSALDASDNDGALAFVQHLVLDEADVLLDPLFRKQTLDIWNSLANPALRVSMWSATMGSNVEQLARTTIAARCKLLSAEADVAVVEAPLIRLVVGLKDSAVPNVQHKLIYAATEQGKLIGLRQLLHPATSSTDSGPALRPPFLVFTQTIERAIALHAELLYDIPAEAGGIGRIAVLHSDLSDTARDNVMTRFRKGEIWVMITTDLLSRGVDFRGVNGVVNYDIPTSSAAYVHRIGRTGRAGRAGGVAVTLYSKEDIPYLKHVANVVAMAQKQGGQGTGMDQWLLDALPTLSKNEKQNLRQRGIESRTARGKQKDPKAARKSQISSKSGYDRRVQNKRKGAIVGSQRAMQAEVASDAVQLDHDAPRQTREKKPIEPEKEIKAKYVDVIGEDDGRQDPATANSRSVTLPVSDGGRRGGFVAQQKRPPKESRSKVYGYGRPSSRGREEIYAYPAVKQRCNAIVWALLTLLGYELPTLGEIGEDDFDKELMESIKDDFGCFPLF